MNYTQTEPKEQFKFLENKNYLHLPTILYNFTNTETVIETAVSGRRVYSFKGNVAITEDDRICSHCGHRMHKNASSNITLHHLNIGGNLTNIEFPHTQFRCPHCGSTKSQKICFKAEGHFITTSLLNFTRDLLSRGTYTNKQVSELTGLNENIVKDIDKKRLQELYTTDNGTKLIKPEKQAKFLGIDEFKLHNGHKYATHIIDLETGHVLWIQNGKKKQVVYDFIEHVGLEWMDGVEAVACDMNSDFQEAFEEKCPHIQTVFDYFHIVKNFNDKVISEVRKEEQRRLYEEGRIDEAIRLKKTRYILMSNRSTLQKKDKDAKEERIIHKGSSLFKTENIIRKGGYEEKYDALLKENKLLFTLDLIKEKLSAAYDMTDEAEMAEAIVDIMDICKATQNQHLLWFHNLLDSHFDGIIAHATYKISSGKIEGINQKIKTIRRHGYGYPDDEYFFLKIMDASRKKYVRNARSNKIT